MLSPDLRDIASLGHDALIITAGQRLARSCRRYIETVHSGSQLLAWREPHIVPFDAWLRRSYASCALRSPSGLPRLLSPAQSAAVWRDVCVAVIDEDALEVSGVTALASACQHAFALQQSWQLTDDSLSRAPATESSAFFLRCLTRFRDRQRTGDWITDPEVGAALLRHRELLTDRLPAIRWFAGFTQLTPIQRSIADAFSIERRSVTLAPRVSASDVRRYQSADDELIAAGDWARQQLLVNADARLAIVVMDLDQALAQKRLRVLEGLDPVASGAQGDVGVEVSVAPSLASYPAVDVALQLLQWCAKPVRFNDLSRLLRSVCFGDNTDAARAETLLRDRPDRFWTPAALNDWLQTKALQIDWLLPALDIHAERTSSHVLSAWAARIAAVFERIGWLRESAPDSAAFQVMNALHNQLNVLATLDSVSPAMNLLGAVATLRRLVTDAAFQPQARYDNVLVCGPLELVGLNLDAVWISGCNASHWPPAGHPSKLLPPALQRDCNMPDATPAQTMAFWQRQFAQLLDTGEESVVSFAQMEGDSELLPSPMIRGFDVSYPSTPLRGFVSLVDSAHVLRDEEHVGQFDTQRPLKGGFSALARQTADPFGAMILGRWRPTVLQEPSVGVSASMRGNLIHASLQNFYAEGGSRDALVALSAGAVSQRIEAATARAFSSQFLHQDALTQLLLRREEVRTRHMLSAFIASEKERAPFRVTGVEQPVSLKLHGLDITLRIDRIDATADGAMIVDYKTGARKRQLKARALLEHFPQLACYWIALPTPVNALALAWINHNATGWDVLTSDATDMPNAKTIFLEHAAMQELRVECEATLMRWAQHFITGQLEWSADLRRNRDAWIDYAPITRLVCDSAND